MAWLECRRHTQMPSFPPREDPRSPSHGPSGCRHGQVRRPAQGRERAKHRGPRGRSRWSWSRRIPNPREPVQPRQSGAGLGGQVSQSLHRILELCAHQFRSSLESGIRTAASGTRTRGRQVDGRSEVVVVAASRAMVHYPPITLPLNGGGRAGFRVERRPRASMPINA
jgi:hypothetical protein